MKEYRIIKQKEKFLGNQDLDFEDELNSLAKQGWQVISIIRLTHSNAMKAVLERDKNR
ncbi:MAG: DUF4177 domain-containing protein [Maribacter sp.]|jgi:basic membrane lipoprotein Med (substrate-binding protein (PBP1-ABC) superfamily)|nr:DUF4177 domain-containing protein [Maribacter sp.]MBT8301874.1 DUF4177 domain-containing protein [Maribacter sp.]NND80463.1 DUF4177 domain-containing protein [Maribacter sp.]NNK76295.1 DUF4177 domain-containing protein [Maribacter sp.]